jgi:hypothetical protein
MNLRTWLVLLTFVQKQAGGFARFFVRDQADGVLSSAAVPHGGLWPPIPPLCRCAEYTADLILETYWAINRCRIKLNTFAALPLGVDGAAA